MITFAKIKKIPEFSLLSETDKMDVLRMFIETYIGSFNDLDESAKKEIETEVFKFYGIGKKSTKKIVNKAIKKVKFQIDELRKNIDTTDQKIEDSSRLITAEIAKNKPVDISPEIDGLKTSLSKSIKNGDTAIKKVLAEIVNKKPVDLTPKIEEIKKTLKETKTDTDKAVSALLDEIRKTKPIDMSLKFDELKAIMSDDKVFWAIQSLSEEMEKNKAKKWRAEFSRDFRGLIESPIELVKEK